MKKLTLIFALISFSSIAQNLSVPDSLLKELNFVQFIDDSDTLSFQISYPDNYDTLKTYPVFLALSGGNQSIEIVNYCYAAWFKSSYFDNFITVLPIAKNGKNLRNYTSVEIQQLFALVKNNFNVTTSNWIIGGTSNGGVATFNFVNVQPNLFSTVIVIPGVMSKEIIPNSNWSHLNVLLAFGSKDSKNWKKGVDSTKATLQKYTIKVQTFEMEKQGHILPLSYDIDIVYDMVLKINH